MAQVVRFRLAITIGLSLPPAIALGGGFALPRARARARQRVGRGSRHRRGRADDLLQSRRHDAAAPAQRRGRHRRHPTSATFDDGGRLGPRRRRGLLRGNDGGNGGALGSVPSMYISHELLQRVWVGLGVDAPFGLRTDWDPGWVGRYQAVVSDLKSVNVNPSLAVRVLEGLSLGAGFDAQYTHVKLTNFLDLGSLCVIQLGVPPAACGAVGLPPQGADAFVKLVGDSWGFGWNVGAMWEPRPGTRVGLTYRSRIQHEIDGDADFTVPQGAGARQADGPAPRQRRACTDRVPGLGVARGVPAGDANLRGHGRPHLDALGPVHESLRQHRQPEANRPERR
jgi:long-chain fatty acid transport protein